MTLLNPILSLCRLIGTLFIDDLDHIKHFWSQMGELHERINSSDVYREVQLGCVTLLWQVVSPDPGPLIGHLASILASHWSVLSVMMSWSRSRTRQMAREIMWVRSSGWHKMSQIGRREVITSLDPIGQLPVMLSPIGWAIFTRSGLMFDSLWSPDYSAAPAPQPVWCCLLELIKILVTIQSTVTYQVCSE